MNFEFMAFFAVCGLLEGHQATPLSNSMTKGMLLMRFMLLMEGMAGEWNCLVIQRVVVAVVDVGVGVMK